VSAILLAHHPSSQGACSTEDIVLQCICAFDAQLGITLIEHGVNVDHRSVDGHTALWWAVVCANVPLAEALIKAGADVNTRTDPSAGSQSTLHCALDSGQMRLLKVLLDAGADPNIKDNNGEIMYLIELFK
jgi:ankyrin repeat protein